MYKVYGTSTKKMLNMLILELLKVYSDEKHKLTQQDIIRLLKSEYGVENCDRRSVKANVLSLVDMGYDISMDEGQGYYLIERDLEDEELEIIRVLITIQKNRMIRCLLAESYLTQSLMSGSCRFSYHLLEEFLSHEMRAGTGAEIAPILH